MQLNPFGTSYSADPAATWRRILDGPQSIGYDTALQLWLIAGHAAVRAALSDPHLSNAATLAPITPVTPAAGQVLAGLDAPSVAVTADQPRHGRFRSILRELVPNTPARAEQAWGDLVARRAEQIADELAHAGSADLVSQVAVRYSLWVICDVLGLPTTRVDEMRRWTDAFKLLVWGNPTPTEQVIAAHGAVALWEYCTQTVDERATSGDPGPGLIGALLRYRAGDDDRLTIREVAAIALNLVGAGWETTSGALGHALEQALTAPDRWARLSHDEHYLTTFVEESLRFTPVIDGWLRVATTEVTIEGTTIPAGARCVVLIGTAGRDGTVFTDPDAFNPGRSHLSAHLAFGAGPHYCIGAALARLELTTMLRTLAQRLPGLRLSPDYVRRFASSAALRNHLTMPAITAAAGTRCPVTHGPMTAPR